MSSLPAKHGSDAKSSVQDAPGSGGLPIPSISLPKGGGAVKGIGEKFSVNAATGEVYEINMGAFQADKGSLKKVGTFQKSVFGFYYDSKNVIYRDENNKWYMGQW